MTSMRYNIPCIISKSGYMNILSKLLTTSTANEDLSSTEGDIHQVFTLDEVPNNIRCTSCYLLIDSVEEIYDVYKGS